MNEIVKNAIDNVNANNEHRMVRSAEELIKEIFSTKAEIERLNEKLAVLKKELAGLSYTPFTQADVE